MAINDSFYAILEGDQIVPVDRQTFDDWYQSTFQHDGAGHLISIGARQVAKCEDPYVSTVFHGTPFGCLADGTTLWFETLYYRSDDHLLRQKQYRHYVSRAEAQAGHEQIVAALRAGIDPAGLPLAGTAERWGD